MKKILIIFLAVLVVTGAFFGGALCGSRYQRELFYSVDNETTENTQKDEILFQDETDYIDEEKLVDILEDNFNDGNRYDYHDLRDQFNYVNVREDGYGLAVYREPAGMSSLLERWFVTKDGGKNWSELEAKEFPVAQTDIAYIGDTVIRTQSSNDFTTGWVETFPNHGKADGNFVTVETLSGISDCTNTKIVIISENEKDKTLVIGVCPKTDGDKISSEDYLFIGRFDKDLNLLAKLDK